MTTATCACGTRSGVAGEGPCRAWGEAVLRGARAGRVEHRNKLRTRVPASANKACVPSV